MWRVICSYFWNNIGYVSLIRSDAIKLLDEIATHKPELLERAMAINLDTKDNQNCRIVIRANLTEENLRCLSKLVVYG